MSIQLTLTPERAQQHTAEVARMTPARMELARELQQTAFHGRRDYRAFDKDFQPAPLYVTMATAIAENPVIAGNLVNLIEEAAVNG